MSHQPLPASWVDRLFGRFSATWGVQKMGAMFPTETHDEVRGVWAEQLGRFAPESIRAALQSATDSGREWPPSLSEFVEACRQASVARQQHAPVKLLDTPRTSADEAHANVERIRSLMHNPKPGREWAYHLLARGERGETVPMAVRQMAEKAIA